MGVSESNEESTKSESQLHFVGSLELNRAKVVLETLLPLNLLLRSSAPWLSHGTTGQCQIAEASEPWSHGGHHVVWHIVVWSLIAAASNPGYACATADSPVSKTNGQDGQSRSLLVDRSISPKRSFASPPLLPFSALEHTPEGYPTLLPCQESKVTIATRHGSFPNSALQRWQFWQFSSFQNFPAKLRLLVQCIYSVSVLSHNLIPATCRNCSIEMDRKKKQATHCQSESEQKSLVAKLEAQG